MVTIGYHASHEQFSPSNLLIWVKQAEDAGFESILSSDHIEPWSNVQGSSGFTWSWLGAAMAKTSLPFGVVTAPGYRYHPAILAQATATLLNMFPNRFFICPGSGEALNEHIVGTEWPVKKIRNETLKESVEIMRNLWKGKEITSYGLITMEETQLFVQADNTPLVIGPALTAETAEWIGGWADGLITTSRPIKELQKVVAAFQEGGGKGKPMYLKVQVSYDSNDNDALQGAYEQWRNTLIPGEALELIRTPKQFDSVGQLVTPSYVAKQVIIGSDAGQFIAPLKEYIKLGFTMLIIHNVNVKQEQFISFFGRNVLPKLKK